MASPKELWLAAGLRTPFTKIDAGLATRDEVGLGVPVVQAMTRQPHPAQRIDFALWGSVIPNLVYSNVGREVWFDAKHSKGLGSHDSGESPCEIAREPGDALGLAAGSQFGPRLRRHPFIELPPQAPYYVGEGVFFGWPPKKLASIYRALAPVAGGAEIDFPPQG